MATATNNQAPRLNSPASDVPAGWRDRYPNDCGGWADLFRRLDAMARKLSHAATCSVPERPARPKKTR